MMLFICSSSQPSTPPFEGVHQVTEMFTLTSKPLTILLLLIIEMIVFATMNPGIVLSGQGFGSASLQTYQPRHELVYFEERRSKEILLGTIFHLFLLYLYSSFNLYLIYVFFFFFLLDKFLFRGNIVGKYYAIQILNS